MTLQTFGRREFLNQSAGAVGSLALSWLLSREHPVLARGAGSSPRAKSVICLFQHGGPSQVDLFDHKPELNRRHGEKYPGEIEVHFTGQAGNLLGSPFRFAPAGQCGMQLSELLPHTGDIADEITLIRSMKTFTVDHEAGLRLIHNGKILAGRPTWGSWVLYALGSSNDNLPGYVVLADPEGLPIDGVRNWTSGWLPAVFQGTPFRSGTAPVLNLNVPEGISPEARARQLGFLDRLNRAHAEKFPENDELAARIANFEMAARMQTAIPDVLDLSDETAETQKLYGLDQQATAEYGRRCLLARRLVERGVRFVQLFLSGQPWDTHSKNAEQLRGLCGRTDQPSAALVKDLKRRGLLDSTIVISAGEFGRLPISQGSDGRDHNGQGFSIWLAGGGFRGGHVHGATDDFGYKSVDDVVTVHDLHATLLHALGLDHVRLTYPHEGRDDSLTDEVVTGARVIPALLA